MAIANTLTDDLTSAGDLNGDGVVNIADIVCLVNHISINNSSYNSVVFTDLNGDGTTNGEDITYLVNTVMGKKEAGKPVVDTLRVFFEENSANVDGCFNKNIIKTSIRGTKVIIVAYGKRPFVCKAEGLCQDGNLTIYSDTTCTLILNNLCLSSTESAAIVLANKQNVIIKLPKESQNELCDAPFREKDSESFNACLYSKGTITFSGEGNLSVSGKYYHAIASSKNISIEGCNINIAEIQKNGIHCDKFTLKEGKIGINLQNASSKGIKAKEKFTMKGGCIEGKAVGGICIENGDMSYSALLKCNGDMIISDGNIVLKHSGGGGRCISVDGNLTISGGSFTLECNGDGGKYINESSEEDYYTPKCITVDDSVFIKNGTISCHSTGLGGKGIVAGKYLSIGSEQEDNIVYAPTIRVETQGECIINNVDEDLRFGCPKGIKSDSTLFIYSGDIAVNPHCKCVSSTPLNNL